MTSLRSITAVNWLLGTLAIGAAVLWPFVDQRIRIAPVRDEIEATVNTIAEAEIRWQADHQDYRYLSSLGTDAGRAWRDLGLNAPSDRIVVECVPDTGNALVIRGFPAKATVEGGGVAPMLYRAVIAHPGDGGVDRRQTAWIGGPSIVPGVAGLLTSGIGL